MAANAAYWCYHYGRAFAKKRVIEVHFSDIHACFKIPCTICSNRFIHDGELLSHQEAVHAAVVGAKNRHKKPKMNRKPKMNQPKIRMPKRHLNSTGEKEKLNIELQRSRTNKDVKQCQLIEHLIDVTENVVNELPGKNLKKLVVNEPAYVISGYVTNANSGIKTWKNRFNLSGKLIFSIVAKSLV
ncbi:hypothetical protein LWI29_025724 [Acer saccharum]|uniref:C2H2-type domain-containing protein n=1 Tax=Acer saccharum TaxID=4024 RepID=A0AA39SLW6_ACESA|nr:hypothetical protein LWI29_025724 [Acer saccharum]